MKDAQPVIAVATHAGAPEINADDLPAFAELEARTGLVARAMPWNAADGVDWGRFRAVVIRSTWGYYRELAAFRAWAAGVEAAGTPLWNPAPVVAWNSDKKYLLDLEAQGVAIVPTVRLERGSRAELAGILAARGWADAVVKPAVSASAFGAWTTAAAEADRRQPAFAEQLAEADLLVQPLLPEIRREGEWSLIYFANQRFEPELSHAVLKSPKSGDFRVQSELGGAVATPALPGALRAAADASLAAARRIVASPVLYARVDGVVSDGSQAPAGTFLLMELELIEPSLFLGSAPGAAGTFAASLAAHL